MKSVLVRLAVLSLMFHFGVAAQAESNGNVTAPDGTVWYPATKGPDGKILDMTWTQAYICCNGPITQNYPVACTFGADGTYLPSEDDYENLAYELGYAPEGGFNPAPIPDLGGNKFWSSTADTFTSGNYWYFNGSTGDVANIYGVAKFAVRCVGR